MPWKSNLPEEIPFRIALDAILDQSRSELASVIAFTNGELLDEKRARSLRSTGLLGAFVSLDAPFAAEHDQLRGRPGLFEKALRAIAAGRAAGLVMGISTYLTDERVKAGYVEKFIDLAKETQASEVTQMLPSSSKAIVRVKVPRRGSR